MATGMGTGCLLGWPGVAGVAWERVRGVAAGGFVEAIADSDFGGACLGVPAGEAREIDARGVLHRADKVLDGDGLVVMPRDVEIHALAEIIGADQLPHHPHHLGAFLVDRGGVEVVDLHIGIRAHRVRHRPGILGELRGAQAADIGQALDRGTAHELGEVLVAEDGEAFLQRELEPVPAGHAVAGPVMEIFVGDDGLDAFIIGIGGRIWPRQDVLGVEDVEALILHRAHVEVGDGGDVENIEVVFEAVFFLVPGHGGLQAVHGMAAGILVALADIDGQRDIAAGAGGEAVPYRDEIAGHQGKQVGRLGVRVFPLGPMAASGQFTAAGRVAVGEQHRAGGAVGLDGDGVARHHIRPVRKEGDAAEALRLALREVVAAGEVEAGELRIRLGRDLYECLQYEGVRHILDPQSAGREGDDAVGGQQRSIQAGGEQHQLLPIQFQVAGLAVAADGQAGTHAGGGGVQGEVQVHRLHQEGGRTIILAEDGGGRAGGHAIRPAWIVAWEDAPLWPHGAAAPSTGMRQCGTNLAW
jgi:hypothetical protein